MPTVLYHDTTAAGRAEIERTMTLLPSLAAVNPRDARHGNGQYLSDVVPDTRTPGRLAYLFLNDPRGWRRFTDYVAVDTVGLSVVACRPGVFLVPNAGPLDLTGRLTESGPNLPPGP